MAGGQPLQQPAQPALKGPRLDSARDAGPDSRRGLGKQREDRRRSRSPGSSAGHAM